MAAGGGVSHLPQVCSTQSTEERKRPVLETTTPPLLRQLHLLHQQCDRVISAPARRHSCSQMLLPVTAAAPALYAALAPAACFRFSSSFIQLWLMDAPACWVQLQMMDAPSCYSSSYVKLQLIHTSTAGCSLFLQAN
ncbi:uncharacterized protein M6G45_010461 isoform 2-T2 [Spheniscus humboldti]